MKWEHAIIATVAYGFGVANIESITFGEIVIRAAIFGLGWFTMEIIWAAVRDAKA